MTSELAAPGSPEIEPGDAVSAADIAAMMRVCDALSRRCRGGDVAGIPEEVATSLLTAGTLLYAFFTHDMQRPLEPFPDRNAVAATDVVVTTKAMLEAAGLSSFDLAMWSNRVTSRPHHD